MIVYENIFSRGLDRNFGLNWKILKDNQLQTIYRPVRNKWSTCRVLEVSEVSDPLHFNGRAEFISVSVLSVRLQ